MSQYQKGKINLDLLEQETVSGIGISWAICKSALYPRQITILAPHHSLFYNPDALPAAQPSWTNIVKALKSQIGILYCNINNPGNVWCVYMIITACKEAYADGGSEGACAFGCQGQLPAIDTRRREVIFQFWKHNITVFLTFFYPVTNWLFFVEWILNGVFMTQLLLCATGLLCCSWAPTISRTYYTTTCGFHNAHE